MAYIVASNTPKRVRSAKETSHLSPIVGILTAIAGMLYIGMSPLIAALVTVLLVAISIWIGAAWVTLYRVRGCEYFIEYAVTEYAGDGLQIRNFECAFRQLSAESQIEYGQLWDNAVAVAQNVSIGHSTITQGNVELTAMMTAINEFVASERRIANASKVRELDTDALNKLRADVRTRQELLKELEL